MHLKASVPVLFAGADIKGRSATIAYQRWCGDDRFVAWCGGTMIIVANTCRLGLVDIKDVDDEGGYQGYADAEWLRVELARGRYYANRVIMASADRWYVPSGSELDEMTNKVRIYD